MSQNQSKQTLPEQEMPKRSPAEWVSLGISSMLLAGVVGLVISIWVDQRHQQPPAIAVLRDAPVRQVDGQFYVPFTVTNSGGSTAESVQIVAELTTDGSVESGEQQIDFLSAGETESGAFIFTQNPQQGELTLRVASYKLP